MRSIRGEFEARYLLNDMHNIGSIRKVLHCILTGLEDLVPYVVANGELSELITKAIKHNRGKEKWSHQSSDTGFGDECY